MKKIFLLVMIAVFGIQMKAADQFDEIDLRGGWELVTYSGEYDLFTSPYVGSDFEGSFSDCKYMTFGDFICAYDDDYDYIISLPEFTPSSKYEEWVCIGGFFSTKGSGNQTLDGWSDIITDCFISNNNKLHIQLSTTTLHFVIESLNSTEMRLKSVDGKFTATYKRISDPSNVDALTVQSTSEEIYNLNGIKTRTPSKGINIIRRGGKVTKNIL